MTKRSTEYFFIKKYPKDYLTKMRNKMREEKDPLKKRGLLIVVTRHGDKYDL